MRLLSFDRLPAGTTSLDLEVTIEQRAEPDERHTRNKEKTLLWRVTVHVPVLAVDGVEGVLPPTADAEVEAAIRRSLDANWYDAKNRNPAGLRLWLGGEHKKFPELRGVGASLQVELWCEGTRAASEMLTASRSIGFGKLQGRPARRGRLQGERGLLPSQHANCRGPCRADLDCLGAPHAGIHDRGLECALGGILSPKFSRTSERDHGGRPSLAGPCRTGLVGLADP